MADRCPPECPRLYAGNNGGMNNSGRPTAIRVSGPKLMARHQMSMAKAHCGGAEKSRRSRRKRTKVPERVGDPGRVEGEPVGTVGADSSQTGMRAGFARVRLNEAGQMHLTKMRQWRVWWRSGNSLAPRRRDVLVLVLCIGGHCPVLCFDLAWCFDVLTALCRCTCVLIDLESWPHCAGAHVQLGPFNFRRCTLLVRRC